MKYLFTFAFINVCFYAIAQFPIGTKTLTFNDPTRTGGFGSGGGPGRQIQCEIYYPATSAGTATPVASGTFPVIVFGHGFVMSWDAYQNVWENLVPQGYILVFPRTEGSFTPSHNDFGLDLALAEQRMQAENTLSTSLFFNHVANRSAIMGHSMGGGSTILAAANNTNIKTIVCLAPAETDPSAIAQSHLVSVPALVMSGSQDGVTPPVDHHIPIYDSLSSTCKTFISITGGGHCYFANSNLNCDFGEATSSTGISISRATQQDIAQDMYSIWFDFYLKQNCTARTTFNDSLATSSRFTHEQSCSYVNLNLSATVNPSTTGSNGSIDVAVTGGQAPYNYTWSTGATTEDISGLIPGTYTVTVTDDYGCTVTDVYTVGGVTGYMTETNHYAFTAYPNPSENGFTLKNPQHINLCLNVLSANGQKVYAIQNHASEIRFGNDLPTGFYMLEIKDEKGNLLNNLRLIKM